MWVMEMHDAATFDPTNSAGTTRLGEIVIDASADPFHADGLIFASLSAALWPSSPPLPIQGILMSEDEDGLNITGLTTGNSGLGIQQPWM
jgi:hypothetical protein